MSSRLVCLRALHKPGCDVGAALSLTIDLSCDRLVTRVFTHIVITNLFTSVAQRARFQHCRVSD